MYICIMQYNDHPEIISLLKHFKKLAFNGSCHSAGVR